MNPDWTTVEIDVLRQFFTTHGWTGVHEHLPHRSQIAIYAQAAKHKIPGSKKNWTSEEDDVVRNTYPQGVEVTAALLPMRSISAIKTRAFRLEVLVADANKVYVGQIQGELTVVSMAKDGANPSKRRWLCHCKCGRDIVLTERALREGSKHCGCLLSGKIRQMCADGLIRHSVATYDERYCAFLNTVISKYKRGAKERGIPFHMTREQVEQVIHSNCYYCDAPPATTLSKGKGKARTYKDFKYNGMDRLDNDYSIGYRMGNVVPACSVHNRMKAQMSETAFASAIASAAQSPWMKRMLHASTVSIAA